MGKIRKSLCMPMGRCRLTNNLKRLKFIPQDDPQQRDSLQQLKKKKQSLEKVENLISRVTTLLNSHVQFQQQQQKISKHTKNQESTTHSKEKK